MIVSTVAHCVHVHVFTNQLEARANRSPANWFVQAQRSAEYS